MDLDAATVMRPKLVRIGNNCYRRLDLTPDGVIEDYNLKQVNQRSGQFSSSKIVNTKDNSANKKYQIDQLESDDYDSKGTSACDDECNDELVLNEGEEIKTDNRGNCILKIHVSSVFFRYIIGKRGQTKMNIESETRTSLKIPRENENRGAESNFIQIMGRDRKAVQTAKRRIDALVESFRKRQDITHFVAIPLGLDQSVRERFEQFKSEVLSDPKCSLSKGIDETVFHHSTRLHLTLRALYLGDSYERKQSTKLLQTFKTEYLDQLLSGKKDKIQLRIKGLDIMNDDPSEARVLYAKVEEVGHEDLLKSIANQIYDRFTPFAKDSYGFEDISGWKVKIHATLLNTRARDELQQQNEERQEGENNKLQQRYGNNNKRNRSKMDVSNILDKYSDYDFGTVTLDQLHICTVHSSDSTDNDYYLTIAKIEF